MGLGEAFGHLLTALPAFLAQFGIALATLVVAVAVVIRATPADELALVRAGNLAAAVWTAGTVVAMAMPIAAGLEAQTRGTDSRASHAHEHTSTRTERGERELQLYGACRHFPPSPGGSPATQASAAPRPKHHIPISRRACRGTHSTAHT